LSAISGIVDALREYGPWAIFGGMIVFGLFWPGNGIMITMLHIWAKDRQDKRLHEREMARHQKLISRRRKESEDDR